MRTTILLAGCLSLALAVSTGAIEPQSPTIESLDAEIDDLTGRLNETTEELQQLKDRVRTIEDRLGESYRSSSPFDTIERRLEELER